jgi:hypothetical protein
MEVGVVVFRSLARVKTTQLATGWRRAQIMLKPKRHLAKGCNLANPKNRMNS